MKHLDHNETSRFFASFHSAQNDKLYLCWTFKTSSKQVELEAAFQALVKQWREENHGVSSTNQILMHSAYQQIIGMGDAVIPLLLRELEKKSGQWFWALKSIAREDPVPPENRGKTKEMIKAWLDWGRQRGYFIA